MNDDGTWSDMVFIKADGAPKKTLDSYKAFVQLYGDSVWEKLPDDERKIGNYNKAYKEAYDKKTSKQDDEISKLVLKDGKRYEKQRHEFNEKGWYTMEDGSWSIDNIKTKKKKVEAEPESGKKSGPKKLK